MNPSPNTQLIRRHVIVLFVAVIILAGAYWLFQSITTVTLAGAVLVLVHLLIATGALYLGSSRLVKFIQKLHEVPANQTQVEKDG
jgi:apolipoprotein N-acyltransferase